MKQIGWMITLPLWLVLTTGFDYKQPGYPETGIFLDTLKLGDIKLRFAITIQQDDAGIFTATFNSIDQGSGEIAFDEVNLSGMHLYLHSRAGIVIEGDYTSDKSKIVAEFRQGTAKFPLEFERINRLPVFKRPQEPKKPYPYFEEEVFFMNEQAGIRLAGTLTLPQGAGPFPAVVLLSGSGPQNRNEELLGHKPFLVLADYLTRHGIAVLRFDDRGVEGSSGDFTSATTADFADDGLAGIDFLKKRSKIDPRKIGFIGHSEGGMMAPIAAVKSSHVAFMVLLAGPGANLGDNVTYQRVLMAKNGGASDAYTQAQEKFLLALNEVARKKIPDDSVRTEAKRIYTQMSEAEKNTLMWNDDQLNGMAKVILGDWWRYGLRYNPEETLKQVHCPVLALLGEKDQQVPVALNQEPLERALRKGNKKSRVVVMPGLNHLFQTCTTGQGAEYIEIEETISPAVLELVTNWILDLKR